MFKKAFAIGLIAISCMSAFVGCEDGDKVADANGNLVCCGKITFTPNDWRNINGRFKVTNCRQLGNVSGNYDKGPALSSAQYTYNLYPDNGGEIILGWDPNKNCYIYVEL